MSVRKRTWESGGETKTAWVVDYKDQDGKRRLKTFAKKKEADVWAPQAAVEVQRGTHTPDSASITVKEAADIWIEAVRRGRGDHGPAESSTLRQYEYHRDTYIVPQIGKEKLSKLSKARVVSFRDALLGDISRPLAKKVLTSLKGILNEARHRGYIAHDPAAGVKISNGSREKEEVEIPSVADIKAILAKLVEKADTKAWRRWQAMLQTAIHTGMRASEVRGLPWGAIDLDVGRYRFTSAPTKRARSERPRASPAGARSIFRARWCISCGNGRWNAPRRMRRRWHSAPGPVSPNPCPTSMCGLGSRYSAPLVWQIPCATIRARSCGTKMASR